MEQHELKHPPDKCEKYEGKWDFDKMVQDCIDNTEDIWVHPVKVEEDLF